MSELAREILCTNGMLKEALTIGQLSMHKVAWQSVSVKVFSRISEARRIVQRSTSNGVVFACNMILWSVQDLQNKYVSSKETK